MKHRYQAKYIMNTTIDSATYNKARKYYLEDIGAINCSYCPYHRRENWSAKRRTRNWKKYRKTQYKVKMMKTIYCSECMMELETTEYNIGIYVNGCENGEVYATPEDGYIEGYDDGSCIGYEEGHTDGYEKAQEEIEEAVDKRKSIVWHKIKNALSYL